MVAAIAEGVGAQIFGAGSWPPQPLLYQTNRYRSGWPTTVRSQELILNLTAKRSTSKIFGSRELKRRLEEFCDQFEISRPCDKPSSRTNGADRTHDVAPECISMAAHAQSAPRSDRRDDDFSGVLHLFDR